MCLIMREWGMMEMNKESIVKKMIEYIEQEERSMQAAQIVSDTRGARTDIVNKILAKLEKEIDNEN